jgi:NADH dehydrogenase FAD-containing subunit
VGLEVAEYLHGIASEITVVEMLDKVAKDLGQLRSICVMESLEASGVKTLMNAKCVEIKEQAIVIESMGRITEYPCDSVVVAIGAKSRNFEDIHQYCEDHSIPCHAIGDAVRARRALNAVAEANEVARVI